MNEKIKNFFQIIVAVIALYGLYEVAYRVNRHFGELEGEIDFGVWYIIESNDGTRSYMKGIDSDNTFMRHP